MLFLVIYDIIMPLRAEVSCMKVYKKRLPEGVRKQFALEKGIKVKVLNSLYYDKKKKNTKKEK